MLIVFLTLVVTDVFFFFFFFTEVWVTTSFLGSSGLLTILADFISAVVWMDSILPLIFSSPSLFFRFLETVQLWLELPSFLCSTTSALWQGPAVCLSFRFLLFRFCCSLQRQQSPDNQFFFLLIKTRSGLLSGIEWSVYISISQRLVLGISFSATDSGLCQ